MFGATSESRPRGWFQPYAGVGIGPAFPNVETQFNGGVHVKRYEWRGPAFQALVGGSVAVTRHVGLFLEYKFDAVVVNANIPGGTQRSEPHSHEFIFGSSLNF